MDKFLDHRYGGVYWMLDGSGAPLADRKQIYAQAFAIYGMSEYFRASGDPESLLRARQIYQLIEETAYDPIHKGYLEAFSRDWSPIRNLRLSVKEPNYPKSMNTHHLHLLEAYTNLLRVWPDPGLRARQKELLEIMMSRIVDHATGHFHLFLDREWHPLPISHSFGHDIEDSWLLVDAAEVLCDKSLLSRTRELAVRMAQAVFDTALDSDGSLFSEADSEGRIIDPNKLWYTQAEAVVGL